MFLAGEQHPLRVEGSAGIRRGSEARDERMLAASVAHEDRRTGSEAICTVHPRQWFIGFGGGVKKDWKIGSARRHSRGPRWSDHDWEERAEQDGARQH